MTTYFRTRISAIGPDVSDLVEGGVLILFAEGAPLELAEVSVLHQVVQCDAATEPPVGSYVTIGDVRCAITAVGAYAWKKVADMGHVVVNFNGASEAERPGEICAEAIDSARLISALAVGAQIVVAR